MQQVPPRRRGRARGLPPRRHGRWPKRSSAPSAAPRPASCRRSTCRNEPLTHTDSIRIPYRKTRRFPQPGDRHRPLGPPEDHSGSRRRDLDREREPGRDSGRVHPRHAGRQGRGHRLTRSPGLQSRCHRHAHACEKNNARREVRAVGAGAFRCYRPFAPQRGGRRPTPDELGRRGEELSFSSSTTGSSPGCLSRSSACCVRKTRRRRWEARVSPAGRTTDKPDRPAGGKDEKPTEEDDAELHDQTDRRRRAGACAHGRRRRVGAGLGDGGVFDARPGLDPLRGARLPGLQGRDGQALPGLPGDLPERQRRRGATAAAVQFGDHPRRQGCGARPGGFEGRGLAGQPRAEPGHQGHRL